MDALELRCEAAQKMHERLSEEAQFVGAFVLRALTDVAFLLVFLSFVLPTSFCISPSRYAERPLGMLTGPKIS